ncbi:UNVERIFIED_CONTAM: hypothetical protein K2H54_054892 [Gekko kuhli]
MPLCLIQIPYPWVLCYRHSFLVILFCCFSPSLLSLFLSQLSSLLTHVQWSLPLKFCAPAIPTTSPGFLFLSPPPPSHHTSPMVTFPLFCPPTLVIPLTSFVLLSCLDNRAWLAKKHKCILYVISACRDIAELFLIFVTLLHLFAEK